MPHCFLKPRPTAVDEKRLCRTGVNPYPYPFPFPFPEREIEIEIEIGIGIGIGIGYGNDEKSITHSLTTTRV